MKGSAKRPRNEVLNARDGLGVVVGDGVEVCEKEEALGKVLGLQVNFKLLYQYLPYYVWCYLLINQA